MALNEDKFGLLRYDPLRDPKADTTYECNRISIEPSDYVKDLEVHMSQNLTFTRQIDIAAERNKEYMLTLWKTLVLPKPVCCCQLWSSHKEGDIAKLEAVQRTFTSRIEGMQGLNYWERLKELRL
ncbi:uncharacterized protein LOC143034869 [Oratosquilla oratoria]|uniref:uncharacterized protein LOC143034869 n=1 Tax=Oratosquilla oratoria TaxID=337810 RepID=UPI003F75A92E